MINIDEIINSLEVFSSRDRHDNSSLSQTDKFIFAEEAYSFWEGSGLRDAFEQKKLSDFFEQEVCNEILDFLDTLNSISRVNHYKIDHPSMINLRKNATLLLNKIRKL